MIRGLRVSCAHVIPALAAAYGVSTPGRRRWLTNTRSLSDVRAIPWSETLLLTRPDSSSGSRGSASGPRLVQESSARNVFGTVVGDNASVASEDHEIAVSARWGVVSPSGALAAGVVVLVFTALSVPLAVIVGSGLVKTSLAPAAVTLAFWVVGVLVARREPHNPIGWMLIASGALVMIGLIDAEQYSLAVYVRGDHQLPLGDVAVIVGQCWPAALLFPPLAILLFPDGRLPSRHWNWVVWIYAGASTALVGEQIFVALNAIREHQIRIDHNGGYLTTPAPRILQDQAFSILGMVLFSVIIVSWVMFIARRVISYRRATGSAANN